MQKAIKDIILMLMKDDERLCISAIQMYINSPADIIEQFICELIADGYTIYDKSNDTFALTDKGYDEIKNVRQLGIEKQGVELLPYEDKLNRCGYPDIKTTKELAEYLRCDDKYVGSYHSFYIYKGKKKREINAPSLALKKKQRWILDNILSRFTLHNSVHGFVPNRSIKTNALCHINKKEIACTDLSDFFPSINSEMVAKIYKNMGYSEDVVIFLTKLSTTCDGELPQGAPTSPMLANIAFYETDLEIADYAEKNGLVYSRYADDITISGDCELKNHLESICSIISSHGFSINSKKTHFMGEKYQKKVTGLVVTNQVKVPLKYKKKLRQEIYYCKRLGVSNHLKNTASVNGEILSVNFREYLYGKAYFIKMIEYKAGMDFIHQLDDIFCT